jgi:hypothetical protein
MLLGQHETLQARKHCIDFLITVSITVSTAKIIALGRDHPEMISDGLMFGSFGFMFFFFLCDREFEMALTLRERDTKVIPANRPAHSTCFDSLW